MIGLRPMPKSDKIKVSVNGSPTGEIRTSADGVRVLAVESPCAFTLTDLVRLLGQFGVKVTTNVDVEVVDARTAQQQTVLTAGRALRLGIATTVPVKAKAPAKKTVSKRAGAKKPVSRKGK